MALTSEKYLKTVKLFELLGWFNDGSITRLTNLSEEEFKKYTFEFSIDELLLFADVYHYFHDIDSERLNSLEADFSEFLETLTTSEFLERNYI